MDRTERFHRIDQLLNDRHFVSMKVLLKELEVSHPTIKRDLEYMRSRLEAPVKWDNQRRGYYYAEPQPGQPRFSLPGLWFSADEIQAFLLMEDLLAQLQPSLLRQHLAPLRTRLEALLAKGHVKFGEVRRRVRTAFPRCSSDHLVCNDGRPLNVDASLVPPGYRVRRFTHHLRSSPLCRVAI